MHMPDLSDEELDALFRQGAERYPEELNLGAWARMEQKLDDARVQQLANRKVARLFAAEIGIVAVLLLLWGGYREYGPATDAAAPEAVATAQPRAAAEAQAAAHQRAAAAPAAPRTTTDAAGPTTALTTPGASVAQEAATLEMPATGTGVSRTPGVAGRGRHRPLLPLAALVAAPDQPTAPTGQDGRAGGQLVASRPRRHHRTGPLLVAAGQSKPMTAAARPAETRGTTQPTTTHLPMQSGAATAGNAAGRAAASEVLGAAQSQDPASGAAAAGLAAGQADNGAPAQPGVEPNRTTKTAKAPAVPAPTVAASAGIGPAESGTTTAANAATGATAAAATSLTAETLQPISTALLTQALSLLPAALPADSIVRRRPRPFVPSRLFISGLYAPELSTVRNAGFERAGHSAGIQVEYRLLPRLRLSVGLLSSVKHYRARGTDYTFAWQPSYKIETIDGTCRITDIPVNLRFDAWQGVRYRAFVGAGMSSLLMRDESYYYNYTNYGTSYTRRWQVKNGKNHPFSVVNFSAGLERQLSLRWSLQAEPYVKLPLGGVGAGKVRLSSGGVFFGLKYGL